MSLFCRLLALLALATGQQLIFISPFGSPTNSGASPSSPLQTLLEAVNAITQPDAAIVAAHGNYRWQQQVTVSIASLNVSCASATPHACRFSAPSLSVCLVIGAATAQPTVAVTLTNIDVDGCSTFATVNAMLSGEASSLVVRRGSFSNLQLAFLLFAVPGSVALQVDSVEFVSVAQVVDVTTNSQYGGVQVTAQLFNIAIENATVGAPFISARADANAFVT